MKPDSVLTVVAVVMCSFEGDGVEEGSIPNPASILALSCLLSTCITDRWRSRKLAITSLVQTGHLCWDGRGQPTHSLSQLNSSFEYFTITDQFFTQSSTLQY